MHLTHPTSLILLLPALAWVMWTAQRSLVQGRAVWSRLALSLRCAGVTLVIFALADPQFRQLSHQKQFVVAVDSSISVQPDATTIGAAFAGQLQNLSREEVRIFSPTVPNDASGRGSHLESMLTSAASQFDADKAPHLIFVSDGVETSGDVVAEASRTGYPISVIPVASFQTEEYGISGIEAPTRLREGEATSLRIKWYSSEAGRFRINVYANSIRIFGETVVAEAGFSDTEIQCMIPSGKLLYIDADMSADTGVSTDAGVSTDGGVNTKLNSHVKDHWQENNRISRVFPVTARPRVLLISTSFDHVRNLENALRSQSMEVDVRTPETIPNNLLALSEFEAVLLSNVAVAQLPERSLGLFQQYVSELGGGLVVCGGDQSFSAGGYAQSSLEEMLPVSSRVSEDSNGPSRAVVLLIDRSSSMNGEKLEMAQASAVSLLNHLSRSDELGVIAFDAQPHEVSALRTVNDGAAIHDEILTITAGGGTTLEPAISAAGRMLEPSKASLRHIILLTDGVTTDSNPEYAVQILKEQGISFSAISIGEDAETALLDALAAAGRGRSWHTSVPSQIPELVLQEADGLANNAIQEEPVDVQIAMTTNVLRSPDFKMYPPLLGFVQTTAKPGSDLILKTQDGRPLLAWWRFGMGTVIAFTSDASGRWTSEWTTWPAFPRFWSQVIRHSMRNSDSELVAIRTIQRNDRTDIKIETDPLLVDDLQIVDAGLTILDPQSRISSVQLQPTAAGSFGYRLRTSEPGPWLMEGWVRTSDTLERSHQAIVIQDSVPELRPLPVSENTLRQIAKASGGLYHPSAADVFRMSQPPVSRFESLREELLCLASLLWGCDVFARKLGRRNESC
ncbi:MAG: VWA domain-containing protein [Planctomyces sp.]|nr:VWA domain-containing protein [Planctomyces sp.]